MNYGYDLVGNRRAERAVDLETSTPTKDLVYAYDAINRLDTIDDVLGTDDVAYTYDANGNTLTKTKASVTTDFLYDLRNQLGEVRQDVSVLGRYGYDSEGLRILKIGDDGRRHYTYDQLSVITEATVLNVTVSKYDYGLDQLVSLDNSTEDRSFFHLDFLGSTANLTEGDGGTRQSILYDAWGNERERVGASANKFTFTGHEKDEETGLIYAKARFYDPDIGRFLNQDSFLGDAGDAPTLHRYAYAHSRPTILIDSDGKQARRPLVLPTKATDANSFRNEVNRRIAVSPRTPVEFRDSGVNVVVMPLPEPFVVQRRVRSKFTDSALSADTAGASETVINTNLYESTTRVPRGLTGPAPLTAYRAQGEIVEGGRVVGGRSSSQGFFFSWTENRSVTIAQQKERALYAAGGAGPPVPPDKSDAWEFGQGDPRHTADVASGGAIPVIINELPYGPDNQYAPGAPAGLPVRGDPGPANRLYLEQRSNNGFRAIEIRGNNVGKVVMGVERDDNLLYIVVQEDGAAPGMPLSEVRDSMVVLGVEDALAWDGSDSATLVRESSVEVRPGRIKDNTIPVGIGFRQQ